MKSLNALARDIALLSAGTLLASAAFAESWALEEIVVTAQKRAQPSQDIGISVTAFAGEDVRDLGLQTPIDLSAQTPGLSTSTFNMPIFSIRGVGLEDFNANNSSPVGVYVDQVFASSPVFLNGQLFDVAQVEVLKGPQGTLYGKNTTGGAITFVSNKPTEETEGYVNLKYGRFEQIELEAAIGGALRDTINGRLAVSTKQDGEGWQKNQVTGNDLGKRDKTAIRGMLQFLPSNELDILWDVHASEDKSNPASATSQEGENNMMTGLTVDRRNPAAVIDPERDEESWGSAVTMNYEMDFATFTSVTAYDDYEMTTLQNIDGWSGISNDQLDQDVKVDQISQELRLTSNSDGDFSWILGINYSEESYDGTPSIPLNDFLMALIETPVALGGLGAPAGTAAAIGYTPGDISTGIYSDTQQDITSFGVFAHTETQLNDQFKLTVGLRYSSDEVTFQSDMRDTSLGGDILLGLPTSGLISGLAALGSPGGVGANTGERFTGVAKNTVDEENISGKVAIDYTPSDDWLFYASVSTGYKGGRYYVGAVPSAAYLPYVEPEELLAMELGFKATLLDSTMQLNGAVYNYDYKDRQTMASPVDPVYGIITFLTNADAKMSGAELDAVWRPIQGLDIKAGIAYLDSEFDGEPDMHGLTPAAGVLLDGTPLSQAPEWSYNLVTSYEFNLSDRLLAKAQLDYSWQDNQVSIPGDPRAVISRVKALGLRFSITPEDQSWEAALWGKNLTDEDDVTYQYQNLTGGVYQSWQMPASYGVELRYNI